MNKTIVTILLLIYSLSSFCQENIEGMYYQIGRETFEIRKDSFIMTIPWDVLPAARESMVVVGKVEQIDSNLLKLNSVENDIHKNISMVQSVKEYKNDSVRIRFHIPSERDLIIKLSSSKKRTPKDFILHYRKGSSEEIVIPKNARIEHYTIREDNVVPHKVFGVFYGKLETMLTLKDIEEWADSIDISIPDIDDMYFYQYYVVDEYARLSGDTISWKGRKYIKNKTSWWDWDSEWD